MATFVDYETPIGRGFFLRHIDANERMLVRYNKGEVALVTILKRALEADSTMGVRRNDWMASSVLDESGNPLTCPSLPKLVETIRDGVSARRNKIDGVDMSTPLGMLETAEAVRTRAAAKADASELRAAKANALASALGTTERDLRIAQYVARAKARLQQQQ